MTLNLKEVISKEEDLTLPRRPGDSVEDVDILILEANRTLEDISPDVEEINRYCNQLDDLYSDYDDLDQSVKYIDDAIKTGEIAGLNPISAELIQIKLRSFGRRHGIDTVRLVNNFSPENFQTTVRTKSQLSLEGIKDFLKGVWEKIKSIIKAVWDAIANFWKKHISTIGRLIKTIEGLIKKAKALTGDADLNKKPKVAPSMVKTFYPKNNNFSVDTMVEMMNRLFEADTKLIGYVQFLTKEVNSKIIGYITVDKKKVGVLSDIEPAKIIPPDMFGSEKEPLSEGYFGVFDETALAQDVPKIEFKWDQVEGKDWKEVEFVLPNKSKFIDLLEGTLNMLKVSKQLSDIFLKARNEYEQAANKIQSAVNNVSEDDDPEGTQDFKNRYNEAFKVYADITKLLPKICNKLVSFNVKAAKGVVTYSKITFSVLK